MTEEVKDLETTENIHRYSKGRNLSWQWTKKRTSSSLFLSRKNIHCSFLTLNEKDTEEGRQVTGTEWQSSQWLPDWLRLQKKDLSDSQDCKSCSCIRTTSGERKIHWQTRWFCLSLLLLCSWHEWRIVGTKRKKTKSKRHIWKCTGSLYVKKEEVE